MPTISHASTFLVTAPDGHVDAEASDDHGLFAADTRFVSAHSFRVNGRTLQPLHHERISYRHARWTMVCTAVEEYGADDSRQVEMSVERLIDNRRLHEDIAVRSLDGRPTRLLITIRLQSDFADLLEIRRGQWQRRDHLTTLWCEPATLDVTYRNGDFSRRCLIRLNSRGAQVTHGNGELRIAVDLAADATWGGCIQYDLLLSADVPPPAPTPCPLRHPGSDSGGPVERRWRHLAAQVVASDPRLTAAAAQASDDFSALRLYREEFPEDVTTISAGIPWFVTEFGRDSCIASMQALPLNPLFALGTLRRLADLQSTVDDPERDAEPGKILHEIRYGEWAHFHIIPHHPYYGSHDSTTLWLLLLGESYRWIGDAERLRAFEPAARAALRWIDEHGDRDGDGFQEWTRRGPDSYPNQNWRDALDGNPDETGAMPELPLATCELQGYVYACKQAVSHLVDAWGDHQTAEALRRQATAMRERFGAVFWHSEAGRLVFALDGGKRPILTVTSNPGQCLWTGIVEPKHTAAVAAGLLATDMFTGWGVRTLSSDHPAYDPHSYQRGSVWPHDSMIAAAGLRRYGHIEECWRIIDSLLDAATTFDLHQLPEVFAGLPRDLSDRPVPYYRANVPQAWAAGAIFHAVRILLGLEPDLPNDTVWLDPILPPWCPELHVDNLLLGDRRFRIGARQTEDGCVIELVATDGGSTPTLRRGTPGWAGPTPE